MLIVMSIGSIQAQTLNISGIVTDGNSEPIIGASVTVKGTTIGANTGINGDYDIVAPDGATLVFSFVGFGIKEEPVNGRGRIDVKLAAGDQTIDDVVVVGYGTQLQKKLSTSISKISSKDINQLPVTNPGDALTGLAAGVQVQSGSGSTPGAMQVIRIRGAGSLGASNAPLYVVDGYPLPNAEQFNQISVSDIESIEILKDAAAAAIYGSRAANGVVLVTTKRGKAGKASFNVNVYTGIQQVTKKIDVMNKDEYLQFAYDIRRMDNSKLPDIYDSPELLPDVDWQDVIFRTAPMSEVQISATGGAENVQYAVSGSYISQDGTVVGTDYQAGTFRANLDADLYPSLKVGVNFAPSFSHTRYMRTQGSYANNTYYQPIYLALFTPPIVPVHKENGDYGLMSEMPYSQYGFPDPAVTNPLSVLELFEDNANAVNLLSNAYLQWEPLKGLVIRTQGGTNIGTIIRSEYNPSTLSAPAYPSANLSTPQIGAVVSRERSYRAIDWVWENTATYTTHFESGHNLSAMLLYSMQKFQSNTIESSAYQSYTNDLVHNPTASTSQIGALGYGLNSFMSYAARVNYDYLDKYILSAAIRTDASSRFGANQRYATFPSVSVAWRIAEEGFMKNQDIFSELKLRGSYGETGNANIGDFTWMSSIGTQNYSLNNQRVSGTYQTGFMNSELTWEKSRQVDIGLETSFLKDRIYLTFDYYNKITQGMLFSKELPAVVGYASTFQTNLGEVRNQGFEIALTTHNLTGDFTWSTDFNISFNRSEVLDLGGRESLNGSTGSPLGNWYNVYQVEVGQPLGNIYGYITEGVYKNEEELNNGPTPWPGSRVGSWRVKDANGDGIVNSDDRTLLGNGLPDYLLGMTNRLTYKNFDLSIILQAVVGNSIVNGAYIHSQLLLPNFSNTKDVSNNYFVPWDPERDVKYAKPGNLPGYYPATNMPDLAVEDGSFLRARNITLGYSLPTSIARQMHLQSARVYLSVQNAFTITKYSLYNPEPSAYGESVYQPGSDWATYPANRTFLLGINLSF
jgi:TonB-linked SusC/RagA family outer membrane protein